MSVLSLVADSKFQAMPPEDQQATLSKMDNAFGRLNSNDFSATVEALQRRALSHPELGVAPPAAAGPHTDLQTVNRVGSTIESELAPNTQNYSSLARTNFIEAPKTLGREVYALRNAYKVPSAAYHAFADPATEEEKQNSAEFEKQQGEEPGTETSGGKRFGLGLGRLTGANLVSGLDRKSTRLNSSH